MRTLVTRRRPLLFLFAAFVPRRETDEKEEAEINRGTGRNPCSPYSPFCSSIHPSIALSTAKVCCDPVFPRPNRSPWPAPRQGPCGQRRGRGGMQQQCRLEGRSSSLALLYLHGAHTSTWKAARWQGRPRARTEEGGGWTDEDGVCEGDKGMRGFNSRTGPGTNWIW